MPTSAPSFAASASVRRWRLIWRDLNDLDTVETTLAGASVLAETCIEAALAGAERRVAARHGAIRDTKSAPQRLVVYGLGKLGGGELNFSSDIDLVLAYAEDGTSDGARPLDADAYYARIGQQFVALLAERDAEGYVYRVDLRLRPFGNSGRTAFSFAAMEQYYQREAATGNVTHGSRRARSAAIAQAGAKLLDTLRPFVFRRYLDYSAFAGLREMKRSSMPKSRARISRTISSSVPAAFARSSSSCSSCS